MKVRVGLPPSASISDEKLIELGMGLAEDASEAGLDPATATRDEVAKARNAIAATVRLLPDTDWNIILHAVAAKNNRAMAAGIRSFDLRGVTIDQVERAERAQGIIWDQEPSPAEPAPPIIGPREEPETKLAEAPIPEAVKGPFREELKVIFGDDPAALKSIEDDSWLSEKWNALVWARKAGYRSEGAAQRYRHSLKADVHAFRCSSFGVKNFLFALCGSEQCFS